MDRLAAWKCRGLEARSGAARAAGLAALAVSLALSAEAGGASDDGPPLPDSVAGGWKVFTRKHCARCHAVWGLGGEIGPDLGRSEGQDLTAAQLTGTLWNHIPKMHSYMVRNHIEYPGLSLEEVSDLFGLLLFVRYLDEPGDAAAGQRVLREKGCTRCHAPDAPSQPAAPDLKRWAAYANPIVWAQKMWQHAPKMEQELKRAGIAWPQLDDTDLPNIMAYLRSIGGPEAKVYLNPGSAKAGARLFAERRCRTCHHAGGPGKDLGAIALPRSLAGLASRMWNHSPEMTRAMAAQGIERNLTEQQMADIVAYIVSLRFEERGGDAQRGRAVLEKKRCVQCHFEEKAPGSTAPVLGALGAVATPVKLAHAMWNHGVTMLGRMSETGLVWPAFQGGEMSDLLAYLESLARPTGAASRPAPVAARLPPAGFRPPPIEPGASCVSASCHQGLVAGPAVHAPAAQGECGACHGLTDPATHRFELLACTSELCYGCHDERGEALRAHGPVAAGVCTACHDPHSAENLFGPNFTGSELCFADMLGTAFALEGLVSGTRLPAHLSLTSPPPRPAPAAPAAPAVAIARAEAPAPGPSTASPPAPAAVRLGPPPGTSASGRGCVTNECHASLVSAPVVHAPSGQGQCELCHVAVDEPNHKFRLAAKEPELCYQCHDRPPEARFLHGPVAQGLCTVCHNPHGAPHKSMLPEAGKDLCFNCHSEMGKLVLSARVQHPVEKDCNACHDPHRGDVKFQLRKDLPDLCIGCHPAVKDAVDAATVAHEPVVKDRKCVNCHNPHGTDVPKLLAAVEMDLCLGCHDKPMDTPSGPIIDMKSWLANNPERHGPIRNESCTGCHQPHGSKDFRLLRHAFPRAFYHPFSLEAYDLCFECHEKTLVLDQATTTLTGFRNGEKNLHYVHVNQKKGRTCRACHEVHAGTKPKRIRDFVPFGEWQYPVNFEVTENGGRCASGCHVTRAYDRLQEVVQK